MRFRLPWIVILMLAVPGLVFAQPRPRKKLIEYGWDVPTPDFIKTHMIIDLQYLLYQEIQQNILL
jgi:hypothetical protein